MTAADGIITTYTYDDNGNTLTRTVGGVLDAHYAYDPRDRLYSASTLTDTTNTTVYRYDHTGMRQASVTNGVCAPTWWMRTAPMRK